MRIAVMGAGGIGSYVGGLLAQAGADVTLVCRGAHLSALQSGSLQVISPRGEFNTRIKATHDTAQVGGAEVVLLTVKLYDLDAATRQLAGVVGPKTMVLPLQNGVSAPEEVGAIVGRERVAAGLVYMNAGLRAPGVVECKSELSKLVIGEVFGGLSGRVMKFRDLCLSAHLDARASEDVRAEQWRKFIAVAALSALGCLSRQPIGPILASAALKKVFVQAMTEVAALATAKGIPLEADIVERLLAHSAGYKYDARVSMLEDLEAGKRLELEWLSGYVSREAARLGVPTPFHDLAYACLKPLSR